MTDVIFRYSKIYDYMLADLSGRQFSDAHEQEGVQFVERISDYWKPLNDKVFEYYKTLGLVLPDFWLAYPVHSWDKIYPFDDPLTFIIKDDLDDVASTLIHELCHVFFGYYENIVLCNKLWSFVTKAFPDEDRTTQEHLPIILLARAGLRHIFGPEKADELLAREKKYRGLERAWQILDAQSVLLEDPIEAICGLSGPGAK